ncbi:MAG: helix-turn-helix transcriptional regulator [Brachyspira sp.]|nr:helix-turn-helix transcriptional regulator [Brachyspira sp.]
MSRLKTLGQNIAKFRQKKNLSQEKLAELVDLSREYVTRVERGQKNISLKKLFAIADALDVKFCELTNFD